MRCLALVCFIALLFRSTASPDSLTECKVKSAFLYNFAKFVKWPPNAFVNPDALFTICTLGDRALEGTLDETIAGKNVEGHPLTARKLANGADMKGCQVLFVAGSELSRTEALLSSTRIVGILTVSEVADAKDPLRHLPMIAFVPDSKRIRFAISNKAAEKAGVEISSKLLTLAIDVE